MLRPKQASPGNSPFGAASSVPEAPRGSVRRHWLTVPVLMRGAMFVGVPRESCGSLLTLAEEAARAVADQWGSYDDGAWSALSRFAMAAVALRAPRKRKGKRDGSDSDSSDGAGSRPQSPNAG